MVEKGLYHILVVDDDIKICQLLGKYLQEQGFFVSLANDAVQAREVMESFMCDLMIVDVMMPGETGLEFTRSIRQQHNQIPVIMLTAMGETTDRILGYESGADDYLPKPFEPKELVLKIRTILKRVVVPFHVSEDVIKMGELRYNIQTGDLKKSGIRIPLTSSEITLLNALAKKPGTIISREDLAAFSNQVNERTIDVQITRLRQKMEDDPKNPIHLQTVRNKGYVLYAQVL
ncbi:MAG: response regulator [Alphaproteobacteria bacterium]|nr:response regulator [Alphaproteobacteria bacterium]